MHTFRSPIARVSSALSIGIATIALIATPALAHVEAEGSTADSGLTTVAFGFTHGCNNAPTTSIKVELPAGTTDVTAQSPDSWTATVTDTTIVWSGGSIPDATPGEFVATMRLIGAADETIYLPTVQGCAKGENLWIERTPDAEAENAAPRIHLSQAVAAPPTSVSPSTLNVTKTSAQEADAKVVHDSENSSIGAIVGGIVLLVIVAGGAILYLKNRRPAGS